MIIKKDVFFLLCNFWIVLVKGQVINGVQIQIDSSKSDFLDSVKVADIIRQQSIYGRQIQIDPSISYYVDSVKVVGAKMLNIPPACCIENIRLSNEYDPLTKSNRKIFIITKKSKDITCLSLAKLVEKSVKLKKGLTVLYMIDGEFIKDTMNIKIEPSYVQTIQVLKSSDFKYLTTIIPSFIIVAIETKDYKNALQAKIYLLNDIHNKEAIDHLLIKAVS